MERSHSVGCSVWCKKDSKKVNLNITMSIATKLTTLVMLHTLGVPGGGWGFPKVGTPAGGGTGLVGVPGGGWEFPLVGTPAGGGPRPCCGGLVGVPGGGSRCSWWWGSLLVTPSTPPPPPASTGWRGVGAG